MRPVKPAIVLAPNRCAWSISACQPASVFRSSSLCSSGLPNMPSASIVTSASPIASRSSAARSGRSLSIVCQKKGSMLSKPSFASSRTVAAGLGAPARTIVPMRMSFRALMGSLLYHDVDAAPGVGAPDGAQRHREAADIVVADGFGLGPRAHGLDETRDDAEVAVNAVGGLERRYADLRHVV